MMADRLLFWSSTKETGSGTPHRSSMARANWIAARLSPPSAPKLECSLLSRSDSLRPSVSSTAYRPHQGY